MPGAGGGGVVERELNDISLFFLRMTTAKAATANYKPVFWYER